MSGQEGLTCEAVSELRSDRSRNVREASCSTMSGMPTMVQFGGGMLVIMMEDDMQSDDGIMVIQSSILHMTRLYRHLADMMMATALK